MLGIVECFEEDKIGIYLGGGLGFILFRQVGGSGFFEEQLFEMEGIFRKGSLR